VVVDSANKNKKSVARKRFVLLIKKLLPHYIANIIITYNISIYRSRSSPNKKIAKKLILGEDTGKEDDSGCADGTTKPT
jgi:hypothetical protein